MSELMLVESIKPDPNESFITTPSDYNDPNRCWQIARKNYHNLDGTFTTNCELAEFFCREFKVTDFMAQCLVSKVVEIITSR